MSKSAVDENSRILLTDDSMTIRKKIRGAVTDSIPGITYDPIARPGTSNLLTLLAGCLNEDVVAVAERYRDKNHGTLKNDVFEAVEETVKVPRAEFLRLRTESAYLQSVAEDGTLRARSISSGTVHEVRNLLGLFP